MMLSNWADYYQQDIPAFAYLGIIISFLVIGSIAAFAIYRAATSVLTKTKTESNSSLGGDTQKFLLQLGGLYFVVNSLAYLPRSLGFIPNSQQIEFESLLWPAGLVIQLIVGLLLVVTTPVWVKLFHKLRGRT